MTAEKMRDEFLEAIAHRVKYALDEARAVTPLEKLNLLAFTFLSMLDGCSLDFAGCDVIPHCDDDGNKFNEDIAGSLHEHWHRFEPKEVERETRS